MGPGPADNRNGSVATHHLATSPGTDYAVLAFLIRSLLRDGCDRDYIDRYVVGVNELAAAVEDYTMDTVASLAGVAPRHLDERSPAFADPDGLQS